MDNAAHTPGPWTKDGDYGGLIKAPDGTNVASVLNLINATKKQHPTPNNAWVVMANADLIAAAPELLEALQALTAVAEGQPRIAKAMVEDRSPLGLARAAIAKATGAAQ